MNKDQRQFLVVGVVLSVAMVIYPPWSAVMPVYPGELGAHVSAAVASGYSWLWSPPSPGGYAAGSRIDVVRLLMQAAALWLLVGLHVVLWAPARAPESEQAR